MSLCDVKCAPCQGGVPPLTAAEAQALLPEVPGWELVEEATALQRKFKFPDFAQALAFANRVGELAEAAGHHPVLTVGWGFCQVRFRTGKIKGLHQNDFIMAARVGALADALRQGTGEATGIQRPGGGGANPERSSSGR